MTGAEVLWPGGARERFSGVAAGGRYLLKQGAGKAVSVKRVASAFGGEEKPLVAHKDSGAPRIILPARIPFPKIGYRDQIAKQYQLKRDGKSRLIVLWSPSCSHCKTILQDLATQERAIRAAGIDVLALSVEGIAGLAADTSASYDLIDKVAFPFTWGLIDAASLQLVHQLQTVLFDRTLSASVPLAILLNQNAEAISLYRGSLAINDILGDRKSIFQADAKQLYEPPPSSTPPAP